MSTTVKWGLITGMIYIIHSLLVNMLGLSKPGEGFSLVPLLMNTILLVATFFTIYLGIKEVREANDGFITFGSAFKSGMGIVAITSVVAAIFTLVYVKLIDPGFSAEMISVIEGQWEEANMPEEQREVAAKWVGIMFKPAMLFVLTIVTVIFWGLIKSLICAAILKKEAPPTIPTA